MNGQPGNSTADIYKAVKQMILSHRLPAGSKISQLELSEQLSISRTPVVKALHKLESEGLVDNVPNRGFFVHQLTLQELLDLFLLRQSFDELIIGNIVLTISSDEVSRLRELFAPFIGCDWTHENVSAYYEADKAFHNSLMELCENSLVKRIDDHFQIYGRTYRAGLVREPAVTIVEHLEMLDALEQHDEDRAQEVMRMHTENSIRMLRGTIRRLNRLGHDGKNLRINDDVSEVISLAD